MYHRFGHIKQVLYILVMSERNDVLCEHCLMEENIGNNTVCDWLVENHPVVHWRSVFGITVDHNSHFWKGGYEETDGAPTLSSIR